jgi:hypothetical protein
MMGLKSERGNTIFLRRQTALNVDIEHLSYYTKALAQSNTLECGREEFPVFARLGLLAKKYGLSSLLCVTGNWESEGPGAALNSTRTRTIFTVMPFTTFRRRLIDAAK